MSNMLPVSLYGLKVPAGGVLTDATSIPATFRITMAAIDPSVKSTDSSVPARSTLKLVYEKPRMIDDESEDDSEDDEDAFLKALREEVGSDEDDEDESSDDEEKNGGPSDPSKSVKARKEAAAQNLLSALVADDSDDDSEDDMDVDDDAPKLNGISKKKVIAKGKGKAQLAVEKADEDIEAEGLEEVVLCTLEPSKTFQQPLDITIHEDQQTFFKVSGTHAVYLSGNYVVAPEDSFQDSDDEEGYDLSPDEDELDLDEDGSDELDDVDDPRIVELGSEDDEEIPKLIKMDDKTTSKKQKGKNKRPAEDSADEDAKPATIDELMSKSLKAEERTTNGDTKLSKKQLKKLKNNAGKPIEPQVAAADKKTETVSKSDKKVSFAKELEQGPTSSPASQLNGAKKSEVKPAGDKPKATTGVKVVQGVKIDDKKLGSGPQAKPGDTLGMRYIGKLSNGKVFDANKKGTPFRFKLGAGQVIKGWDVGVNGMSVQGERRIVVPAHLAYGNKRMDDIPANSELTFDIKLLEISKK